MTDSFAVRYTEGARDDRLRLFEFLLERARTVEDVDAAQSAIDALTAFVKGHPARTPFPSGHPAARSAKGSSVSAML